MIFALYFLALWIGGGVLLGLPVGLLLGRLSARMKWPVRPAVVLGQAAGVGAVAGWWWAQGPPLRPVWLATLLLFVAFFTVNGRGFARFARSHGAAVEGIWQVLPGVGVAWLVHRLLR